MADQNCSKSLPAGSLWNFIPIDEYKAPHGGSSGSFRESLLAKSSAIEKMKVLSKQGSLYLSKKWMGLFTGSSSTGHAEIPQDLEGLPQEMLNRIVPEPDWMQVGLALDEALEEWLNAEEPSNWVRTVVGAPHSGIQEGIVKLASTKRWKIIDPPSVEQILSGGEEWLEHVMKEDEQLLVLPQLERCYLRHYNGLDLIRRLLDVVLSINRRFLLGCNTWAWAYLSKALDLEALVSTPITLNPFGRKHLQCWLNSRNGDSEDGCRVFRQADTAGLVLPVRTRAENGNGRLGSERAFRDGKDEGKAEGDFLDRLAAYSRGIPGVAWSVWRRSLLISAGERAANKPGASRAKEHAQTIWVKPWSQLALPNIPEQVDRSQLFVLHTILLHDSLPPRLLRQLLSMSTTDIVETLHHLRNTGLLDADRLKAMWRITPEGYPVVRHLLEREGYLVGVI